MLLEGPQHMRGDVVGPVSVELACQVIGHLRRSDLGGVGPGAVEEGAAGAVDGSHRSRVQRYEVCRARGRIIGVGLGQPAPAPAHPDHLVTLPGDTVHHGLDAGVETGDVAAAGQDPDPQLISSST